MEKEFNPVIKAVQRLRKLAVEIKSTNKEIQENDQLIRLKINEAGKIMAATNDSMAVNVWLREKSKLLENANELLGILINLEEKFKNKDTTELLEIWESRMYYEELVINSIDNLEKAGNLKFTGDDLKRWEDIWKDVSISLNKTLSIAETYHLKLKIMITLKPEEIDALTMDILKNIPVNYSDEDTVKYEKEYLQAYNEIKESQSKKKSVWDKVMDILAGGAEETPAHRVQMRRWMDGVES